jgi:hypothetical protein
MTPFLLHDAAGDLTPRYMMQREDFCKNYRLDSRCIMQRANFNSNNSTNLKLNLKKM